jgi:5-methylcytosine-specific restriction endonuclease McrA
MKPTIDHINPYSLGGREALANLVLAHALCNERRGNRSLQERLRPGDNRINGCGEQLDRGCRE